MTIMDFRLQTSKNGVNRARVAFNVCLLVISHSRTGTKDVANNI